MSVTTRTGSKLARRTAPIPHVVFGTAQPRIAQQEPSKESTVGIEVQNLSKRYGSFQAVKDVSFEVPAGQLVALLGPSGSGKSTILRIIAGPGAGRHRQRRADRARTRPGCRCRSGASASSSSITRCSAT